MSESPRAIDRIRSASTAARRKIVVPEWGNLELYFDRLTVSDMEAITDQEPKSTFDRNIRLLVHKAKDADGKPVFSSGDVVYIKTEADYLIVQRVIGFMFETAYGTVEEAKEQLREDPISDSA